MYNNTSNANNNTLDPCHPSNLELSPESRQSYLFRLTSTVFIILVSLVGNGLVIRGAIRTRNRPFSYYLISNLALAELVFIITQPFHFHYNTSPYSWVFGDFMCHVIDPLSLCTILVITFTLSVIAVYRCIILVLPYRRRLTRNVAYLVMACSWIWGITLALPDSLPRTLVEYETCKIWMCNRKDVFPSYRMVIFALNFVIPFTTLVVSYSIVILKVKKHLLRTREESVDLSNSFGTGSSITATDSRQQPVSKDIELHEKRRTVSIVQNQVLFHNSTKKDSRRENKMMQLEADVFNMIYIILFVFFLCYLPSNVMFIMTEVFENASIKSWKYFWLMTWYLNLLHTVPSALHPICYGATSKVLGFTCRRRRHTLQR